MSVHARRRITVIILASLLSLVLVAIDQQQSKITPVTPEETQKIEDIRKSAPEKLIRAKTALGELAVKTALDSGTYKREYFSDGWGNDTGCDTRNLILRRDLQEVALLADGCKVGSGVLADDPYSGERIAFVRGPDTSADIQIDHVVAVSDAWRKGAQSLSSEKRYEFYNDPLNLLAVDGTANQAKSNHDASRWLPHKEYRCRYVARQIAVKAKYSLWITPNEKSAMSRVLDTCPDQYLPVTT